MILIAPDKFKGTLTAQQATEAMARGVTSRSYLLRPMADGGEGTAQILASGSVWEKRDGYFVNRATRTAVLDSSSFVGFHALYGDGAERDIMHASSAPLGRKIRQLIDDGCHRVIIGIGGTATCDAGVGFLQALGIDRLDTYSNKIIGLSDVRVPLVARIGQPSALMFAPQKGASDADLTVLADRLLDAQMRYGYGRTSPWDGAGGGLGFAIATVIGAPCYDGAQYLLDSMDIPWHDIDLVLTGEGRIDSQTSQGKVVDTMMRAASAHGIPCLAFGGCVEHGLESPSVISTIKYHPDLPLNTHTATLRLTSAVQAALKN